MSSNSLSGNLIRGAKNLVQKKIKNPFQKVGWSWFTVKKLKHLPNRPGQTVNFLDKTIHFYSPAELVHGVTEIFVQELYAQKLGGSPYIIDCGANIGLSVIYIKKMYPGAQIVAFEPDPVNFDLLNKNVKNFNLDSVELKKEAVWIADTTLNFDGEGSMSSKISEEQGKGANLVKACRLRDYLNRTVDFLKIDIEGAEYAVLKDCHDQLKLVNNLFLEYHGSFKQGPELIEMLQWIEQAGFVFYIKEATTVFATPFSRQKTGMVPYEVQLNIFCFRP
ncbi:MAG: FkbM family methyltransferase [Chitinophagaceae bacterium]|nr:FkbM family methyltransferase [Chitinophagaceae bacterium]